MLCDPVNASLTLIKPYLLSILGNIFTTSKLSKTQFSDNIDLFVSSIISSILLLSFIFELNLSANRFVFSTKIESFSTTVLQPLVIIRTGLSALCVFTTPCILPALQLSGLINTVHSFVIISDHFSNQLCTFSLKTSFSILLINTSTPLFVLGLDL